MIEATNIYLTYDDNKYIIITTHDDFLIEHLDIVYEIENKQLYCHQEIKEVQQDLKIENAKHQRIKKYFFYKNHGKWLGTASCRIAGKKF